MDDSCHFPQPEGEKKNFCERSSGFFTGIVSIYGESTSFIFKFIDNTQQSSEENGHFPEWP